MIFGIELGKIGLQPINFGGYATGAGVKHDNDLSVRLV